ncbi:peroxisomal enoyl-CoA-hydratase [Gymnopilus junonius]|uniref:Peroxisomal enoyl-CoA-hydratase n=1 Tax=Gymnopilus junonius TaxID=109634 RepID=A0A9P5NYJ6_GYMJU|nr:peroxisomal enoyl-CoA-hydratase [Gymnopilus junonius]
MTSPDYSKQGYKEIVTSLENSVLSITINRAKYRNTFSIELFDDLVHIFDLADRDDSVRAIILTAEPTAPAFCSGADISGGWDVLWKEESEKEGEHAHRDTGGMLSLVIYRCRKITIAAVNGNAAGVGMTALHLPFDFRFVWAGAKLTFPFFAAGSILKVRLLTNHNLTLNLFPSNVTYLLPRLIGHSRATSLLLTGMTVSPDSPYIQSLYHQILPTRSEVYPAAKAFATELVANSSQMAVAYTKGLLQHPGNSIEENHLLDSRVIKLLASSVDGAEGAKSFKERRVPKFTGVLSKDSSPWYPWWHRVDVRHLKTKL